MDCESITVGRGHPWFAAFLILMCALTGEVTAAGQDPSQTPSSPSASSALIDQYCVSCHNSETRTGGLALDSLDPDRVGTNVEVWEKVVRKTRARVMPPAGLPRPDEASYEALLSHLETSLNDVAEARPDPGRTETFQRLNRSEYQNAIRDLLDLDIDVTTLLPADDGSYGFDNVEIGGLSPTILERYLTAAQKISRLALGRPLRVPGGETVRVPLDLTQDSHFADLPFGTRGGATADFNFPQDGEYEIQIRLTRDRNEQIDGLSEPHEIEITLDGARVERFQLEPVPSGGLSQGGNYYDANTSDAGLNVRVSGSAGPHQVSAAFLKRPSVLLETERQPYAASFDYFFHRRTQPALYSISVLGPFDPAGAGDTPSRRRILVCQPETASGEPECARTIISALARRAYRRPVTDSDLQVLMAFYEEARAEDGFEAGIEMALRAILVSPQFLFRIERDPETVEPNTAYRISNLELASRLSFFLWSSIPDDELLNVAVAGNLSDPAILEQQVRRLLADSRSRTMVTNFGGQWLRFRDLAQVRPDPRLFPDFDDNLRQALRQETELFFESIATEDRNVLDLLTANYSFLNERLARHYGIPHVYGSRFRRVTFGEESVRGGLLGQGSILTVTSYATRTSPVLRGKWLLENILGTPPPPPPPNVPPLGDGDANGRALTMRERMVQHRANPVCASCHQLMDPTGLSMENFDAIGRWRTRDRGENAIDALGSLPDGSMFDGMAGLRQALLKRPELFVTTLTEKLLTYAIGRGLAFTDAAEVRKIVRDARSDNYRFSSIVLGVANSRPFQMRRSR